MIIYPSGYWFGAKEPTPIITGFRVMQAIGEWMQATRGNLRYVVRETPTHWILERYGKDIWGRDAERLRKARHRERLAVRQAQEQSGFGQKWRMPPYTGEHLKGCWSVDPSEAIAVRK